MKAYEKPMVLTNEGYAEGIYMASGTGNNTSSDDGALKCDSIYMKGVWQAPDYSGWTADENSAGGRGYKQQFACLGCPANTDNGCGLQTHYVDSNYASSYETDNGNRKPSWEKKGYGPNDPVTDWAM